MKGYTLVRLEAYEIHDGSPMLQMLAVRTQSAARLSSTLLPTLLGIARLGTMAIYTESIYVANEFKE
jgi:hypothetical protein